MAVSPRLAEKLAEFFIGDISEVTLRLVDPYDEIRPRYKHIWSGWRRRLREIPEFVYWEKGYWDEIFVEDQGCGHYSDVWVKSGWRCDYKSWRHFLFPLDRKQGRREVGKPTIARLTAVGSEIRLQEPAEWYPGVDAQPVAVNVYRNGDLLFTVDLNIAPLESVDRVILDNLRMTFS